MWENTTFSDEASPFGWPLTPNDWSFLEADVTDSWPQPNNFQTAKTNMHRLCAGFAEEGQWPHHYLVLSLNRVLLKHGVGATAHISINW